MGDIDKDVETLKNSLKCGGAQKEIEEKEQETKNQNEEKQKKFKEQEKVIEQKQSKLNEEILLRYKPYINNKPEKSKENNLNEKYNEWEKTNSNLKNQISNLESKKNNLIEEIKKCETELSKEKDLINLKNNLII